ncbi:hypothetical protein IEQ34_001088 [Dendrobium chrysotoxum]|uniref:Uncharacterized protein n=1 Tax=Dendrobium chrysotoxum TaxID=161865 RepID=A0AAV7H5X2_DENCH|nr:hypothetical protein IEQ34_001088 [Dendrobium chrysotoxum]
MPAKNFRKRRLEQDELGTESEDEDDRRMALEEVMFLQKQRERKTGISALPSAQSGNSGLVRSGDKAEGDGEKEDLVLQDTFAQETAVIVEDPNMLKYVDQELAKRRGKKIDSGEKKEFRGKFYPVDHWNRGNSTSHRLRNIEETEAAKKILQEKRLTGRTKSESSIPSSYSADYFHRGRDYAEKLRKEHPELYKEHRSRKTSDAGTQSTETNDVDIVGRRQAATDELMLERFRKRERNRAMRR